MARINIEDSLWKDDRFQDLMIKTGNRHTAKGMILELWTLAQEYWFPNRKAIPLERIRQAGLQLVIDVGLAVIEESGVKAIGTDKAFDWLFQRQEAGKKGGKANALRLEAVAKRSIDDQATNQSKLKQIEPSYSFSSSSSFSEEIQNKESIGPTAVAVADSEKKSVALKSKELAKAEANEKAKTFVAAYVKSFQTRFPTSRPEDLQDGKVRGQILNWIASYGNVERACQLIQVYFQMETKWFGTKGYDFMTFRNNLNKIGQALDSGTDPDGNKIDFAAVYGGAGK